MKNTARSPVRPFVVVFSPRRDLRVAESVRFVQVLDRLDVAPHERFAVAPVAERERFRRQEHPLPDRLVVEIFVAADVQMNEPVPVPALDRIADFRRSVRDLAAP